MTMKILAFATLLFLFTATGVSIAGDQCDGPYEAVAGMQVFLWTEGGHRVAAGTTDDKGKFSFKVDKEQMDLLPSSGVFYVTFKARPGMTTLLDQRLRVAYERHGSGHLNYTLLLCNVPLNSVHPQSTAQNKGTFAVSGKSTA
jgi:hypothetical protein